MTRANDQEPPRRRNGPGGLVTSRSSSRSGEAGWDWQQSAGRVVAFLRDDSAWSRGLAWLVLVLAVGQIVVAAGLLATGSDPWGFALVGGICSAVVVVPLIVTQTTVFSLWGPVVLVVTLGTGVRGLAMATGFPNSAAVQDKFVVRGASFPDLAWPAVVTVLSVTCVVAGYLVARRSRWGPRWDGARLWQLDAEVLTPRRAVLVVGGFALVGAAATALYLQAVGGLGSPMSERRTVYRSGGDFQSYGHWEFLAGSGTVALIVYLAWIFLRRDRLRVRDWALFLVLVANAFAINVITTSRSDVIVVTLGMLMVVRLVRGKVSLPTSLAMGLIAVIVFGFLSDLRAAPEPAASPSAGRASSNERSNALKRVGVSSGMSSGLLNRNGYDLSKTLVVVDSVPHDLPYAYGSTMARYVLAPVPRAIWPDKPAISEGVTIGRELYGLERTGIPPGLTGELVWNFGRSLAIVLSLCVGIGLGLLERGALGWPRTSIVALALQALVVLPIGKTVMGGSVGQAMSTTAQSLVLLCPLILLALIWSRREAGKNISR